MARYRRIVGLGLCVIDHLFVVDRFELSEARLRYARAQTACGGMVGNALAQAAALGCNTHVLSVLGDDADGRAIERDFRRRGVKTRRLIRSPDFPTTMCVVLVRRRGGERRFIVPDRRGIEARAPDLDLSGIDRGTILLVDGHFPAQAQRAVARAREVGATVVGDFHTPTPAVRRLLPCVDFPVVPLEFASAYAAGGPRAALDRLRKESGGVPVVTLGARGGVYLDGGRVRRYRAHRVSVADTTGAGDAFHGAFAAALYQGRELARALDFASRAAAYCCTGLGARARLLGRGALEAREA